MNRTAIVVSIEGLGTNLLGPYAAPWAATPSLNDFASHALTLDQCWLDHDDPTRLLPAIWRGAHALQNHPAPEYNLGRQLAQAQLDSWFLSDDPTLIARSEEADFGQAIPIPIQQICEQRHWESCHLAKWMETGLGLWVDDEQRPPLLWLHSQGWKGPWDAPYELRQALVDEEDADPPRDSTPPELPLDEDAFDLAFGWAQAAAAQAQVLDQAWDWIDEALNSLGLYDQCLVVLLGLGGYPLGEHGYIGCRERSFYAERLHSPCILRPGSQLPLCRRSGHLTHPFHLWATLLDWFQCPSNLASHSRSWLAPSFSLPNQQSNVALCTTSTGRAMRVGSWGAIYPNPAPSLQDPSPELYLHPEDRWQRNDVSRRAPHIIDAASEFMQAYSHWLEHHPEKPAPTPPAILLERPW